MDKNQQQTTQNHSPTSQKRTRSVSPDSDDSIKKGKIDQTETYTEYKPAKVTFGAPHPHSLVETAALSAIEPNDITYALAIPTSVIDNGLLSGAQLESIIYASQAHEKMLADKTRAGFLIGVYSFFFSCKPLKLTPRKISF